MTTPTKPLVTWKDEGRKGPMRVVPVEDRLAAIEWEKRRAAGDPAYQLGRPYEPAIPDDEWVTRDEAERFAKSIDADFQET